MRLLGIGLSVTLFAGLGFAGAQAAFDPDQNLWTLNNGSIRAVFQLTAEGYFLTRQLADVQSGDQWNDSANRAYVARPPSGR